METALRTDTGRLESQLSQAPTEWPDEARDAYRDLLVELNDWSRRQGCSSSSNSSVAMRAVREVWSEPCTVQ